MNLFAIEQRGVSNKMLGVHCSQQTYVVAFRSYHMAKYVAGNIHKMPRLVLNANKLTIYKTVSSSPRPSFEIVEYKFDDLVIHPFKNSVGLILPFQIVKDDPLHIVFESNVIQPCSDDVCALMKYGVRSYHGSS